MHNIDNVRVVATVSFRRRDSGHNVFITGAAGTGKSYLFETLVAQLKQRHGHRAVAVTATTGVAATHVNGITIHAWSGVGKGDADLPEMLDLVRDNAMAKMNWLNAKVLLVDEVSMLRGELFELLSRIGCRMRSIADEPFGGIQVVACGDFYQLPPIAAEATAAGRIRTDFCFLTKTWKQLAMEKCTLHDVIRQRGDVGFASLLSEIRVGMLTHSGENMLKSCSTSVKAGRNPN